MEKNQIYAIIVVIIIVVAAVAVAAVALTGSDDDDTSTSDDNDSGDTSSDEDYYPVTISTYDPATGDYRDVTFYEAPTNIIAYQGGALELLLYFGLGDSITKAYVKSNYVLCNSDLQSELDKVDVEDRDNASVELLVSMEPDLIVGWSSTFKETAMQTMDYWEELGTNCYCSNYPNSDLDAVYFAVQNIGIIFNMQDKAQEYIDQMEENIEMVNTMTASLTDDEKPTVLAIEVGYSGWAFCYGSDYITGKLIELAGGISAYTGGMDSVTYEEIAALEPDIILVVVNSGDFRDEDNIQSLIDDIKAIDGFGDIPAVVNDRFISYGLYEVYQSGIIPPDILERLYNDIYSFDI